MPTLAVNKKSGFDYEILEEIEAGLVLTGGEVKSAKLGHINLTSSYAVISSDNKLSVIGMQINPYGPAIGAQGNYDPKRTRSLLLKSKEIDYLKGKISTSNLTIVPLSVYTKGTLIKMKIGLARGKKQHDKRESIKKHDIDRDIQRQFRRGEY